MPSLGFSFSCTTTVVAYSTTRAIKWAIETVIPNMKHDFGGKGTQVYNAIINMKMMAKFFG